MMALGTEVNGVVLNERVTRSVLLHQHSLMLVQFEFKQGGVGEPHCHEEHEQIGYIAKGVFEVMVAGETQILSAGDSYYAGKNEVHGVVALADGIIIDTFTPVREDFLD